MLNRLNGRQELDRVNMFIRALSDEMAHTQARNVGEPPTPVALEIEEALFELRLRKLLISAMFDSDRTADNVTSH